MTRTEPDSLCRLALLLSRRGVTREHRGQDSNLPLRFNPPFERVIRGVSGGDFLSTTGSPLRFRPVLDHPASTALSVSLLLGVPGLISSLYFTFVG
jgi:hypothetical protein